MHPVNSVLSHAYILSILLILSSPPANVSPPKNRRNLNGIEYGWRLGRIAARPFRPRLQKITLIMANAHEHHFSDGSSITVLENGAIILRETKTPNHELLLLEPTTGISYNDPPPPPVRSDPSKNGGGPFES